MVSTFRWVEGSVVSISVGRNLLNIFHLTWYPGEPLRRINRERFGERLSQHGGYFAVHFDRPGFRGR